MKRICFLVFFILLYFFSYSQAYKIENKTKEAIENNVDCIEIDSYDHPISFILCNSNKIIYSSFIVDTVVVYMEFFVRYFFTDTTDYIVIDDISKLLPDNIIPFCSDKEQPKDYFQNKMMEFFNSCSFYYVLRGNTIKDFGEYYRIPIKFVPNVPPCDNTIKIK